LQGGAGAGARPVERVVCLPKPRRRQVSAGVPRKLSGLWPSFGSLRPNSRIMGENATVLFKFRIPELAHLPPEEQQRVLALCWESDPVQAAWRRYWARPLQLPFLPIIAVAIYGALANLSLGLMLLISIPMGFIGFFIVRRCYRGPLVSALRAAAVSRLPQASPHEP